MRELRSWVHTLIGDRYAAEEKWNEAELAYTELYCQPNDPFSRR
jgi:hypothetical protein